MVTVVVVLFFFCLPVSVSICYHYNRHHYRTRRIHSPWSAVVATTTTSVPQATVHSPHAQQAPPPHPTHQEKPLPYSTLQQAPPPAYNEAAAYASPTYPAQNSTAAYPPQQLNPAGYPLTGPPEYATLQGPGNPTAAAAYPPQASGPAYPSDTTPYLQTAAYTTPTPGYPPTSVPATSSLQQPEAAGYPTTSPAPYPTEGTSVPYSGPEDPTPSVPSVLPAP